jgi:hypothetical protein
VSIDEQLERRRAELAAAWSLTRRSCSSARARRSRCPAAGTVRTRSARTRSTCISPTASGRGGVLAFDPAEGWVDFVVPVSREEMLWEGASPDAAGGAPDAELGRWLEVRFGRPVARLGAATDGGGPLELRIDLPLVPGRVVTIGSGVYFVPALLGDAELRERHRDGVDWDRAERMLGFGGIRIEHNVLGTDGEPEVLTADIPLLAG